LSEVCAGACDCGAHSVFEGGEVVQFGHFIRVAVLEQGVNGRGIGPSPLAQGADGDKLPCPAPAALDTVPTLEKKPP
jgi:hypothetical protein